LSLKRIDGSPVADPIVEAKQDEVDKEAPRLVLEDLLPTPDPSAHAQGKAQAPRAGVPGMRTARVVRVSGRTAAILFRGAPSPIDAVVAPEVEVALVDDARLRGDSVLIELWGDEPPVIVGILQTRRPQEIRLKAATVHIEGEREILLRSGHGAIRIREDGNIEVVGSRINAASRGLFQIIGRILRLN
jgi:hypothetical protein